MSGQLDVVVLGGGISGLTAGFLLKRRGFKVLVLEASGRPGGSIATWKKDGFIFELGPNTVLNNAFEIDSLCGEAGIMGRRISATPKAAVRYIVKNGRLVKLPGGPFGFAATPLFSLKAKLRLLQEPFIKPAPAETEESIATFVKRRLGREFLDYAVGPFVSGVYAGDPEKLSVRHAVPKIYALEEQYGSLIKGAIRKRKGPAPQGGLFSFENGLEELPLKLAELLGPDFSSGTAAVSVGVDEKGYLVEASGPRGPASYKAKAVILAMPSDAASTVLKPIGGDFQEKIASLPYAAVATVCLGYRREQVGHSLEGFGFLCPEIEQRHVLGCLFPSSLFVGRAPEGFVALTSFVGGAVHPERALEPKEAILKKTAEALSGLLGIKGEPVISRVEQWPRAIPQYTIGHGVFKDAAAKLEKKHPGLFVSGNLLYGVSLGNCIQNAAGVAARAAAFIKERI